MGLSLSCLKGKKPWDVSFILTQGWETCGSPDVVGQWSGKVEVVNHQHLEGTKLLHALPKPTTLWVYEVEWGVCVVVLMGP